MEIIDKLGFILIKDKKILLCRSKGKDVYYIPGGKRKEGETDEQALVREIKEELNVDLVVETLKHFGTFKAQAHGKPEGTMVQATCYSGEFEGELQVASEIEEIAWLTYKDKMKTGNVAQIILDYLKERNLID